MNFIKFCLKCGKKLTFKNIRSRGRAKYCSDCKIIADRASFRKHYAKNKEKFKQKRMEKLLN